MRNITPGSGTWLDAIGVEIDEGATFGFEHPAEIHLEPPLNVRRGIYDVEFIGGFTYLGGRETLLRHVWMIGRFCAIASNVVAGQVEHPTDFLSPSPIFARSFQWPQLEAFRAANPEMTEKSARATADYLGRRFDRIRIGNDVWIGEGAFIRRGVSIGDGAIVASRSVVTGDVPPYAIVGGTPARIIRYRFEAPVVDDLLRLSWWTYGLSALHDVDFTDIHQALKTIERNIVSGRAQPYETPIVRIDAQGELSRWRYDADAQRLLAA
ncbi:CatB-related O-acetyltransferase [Sphingosinicella terrae]|uniref:CatB-related O-acetyltransferase n=1 Tax=Sphingosinicella terrae TaxID=2172047 RepID=UPI000E0D6D95|nr:CatB-related O-acetyltransferase [Sphingosinicella terrae]